MLRRLVPRRLRQEIVRVVSSRRLGQLPRIATDARNLRADVPALDPPGIAPEWATIESAMNAAGISPRAGGVNVGDRRAIYQLTRSLAPRNVLEVGTHVGASTLMFALALRASNGHLTTVDIQNVNAADAAWKRTGCARSPRDMLAAAGCADRVRFVTQASIDFLQGCVDRYDLVFLDGLHEAPTLYQEIPLALQVLAPGGLILLHDVFPNLRPLWPDGAIIPGPWLALQRLKREGARLDLAPLGDLPWPTKLGTRRTSLAMLVAASAAAP